jgi:FAD/FMN-containing dehydrogenase
MIDLNSLRSAFAGRLLTERDDVAPFVIDWRNTWRGTALAVAQPECVDDVASVVKWCAANGVSIVPQGGNTGQSGGSVPGETGQNIVLSLTRLNKIRAVDPVNNTVTVDAGCILQTVQEAAAGVDRFFPLSLGAEGSCTIGGNLATNAGGTAVLRYGNMRDLCLGLEVVTASGEIWNGLRGLRKDNSGYDLRDLFIGSEGTLGVITGAVLKTFPKPAARLTAFLAVKSPQDAMALFHGVQQAYDTALTGFELLSDVCLDLVLKHVEGSRIPLASRSPWYVLIEFTDLHSDQRAREALQGALETAFAGQLIQDAVIGASVAQCRALWSLRESISPAQGREGKAIKHDVAVPISGVADFIDEALAAVAQTYPDFRPVIFGHLGDGNLHFNFSSAPGADQSVFVAEQDRLNRNVHDIVRSHHGTISAEHGLGVLRRDEADAFRSPVEKRLMASIKAALDPAGLMNPGKMFA